MNPKGSGREEGKEEKMSLYRHFYKEGIKWPTLKEAGHYCKLGKAKHVRVLHTHYNGWRHSQVLRMQKTRTLQSCWEDRGRQPPRPTEWQFLNN